MSKINPAILVTSHPNTDKKEQILKDFGNFISQYNIDNYLFTNFPATKETQLEFKESHFINFNPKGPWKGNVWTKYPQFDLQFNKEISNWCYSGTNLILQGIKYLKSLGYTHVIMLMYDVEPNFYKVKKFIKDSLESFKTKKGVFYQYDPKIENSLSTSVFSSEINFFINIFTLSQQDYLNKNTPGLCEPYWYDQLIPFKNDIDILPYKESLKTIYHSVEEDESLIEGKKYNIGYFQHIDKTLLIIDDLDFSFEILENSSYPISYKTSKKDNLTLIKFQSHLNNSYSIQCKNNLNFLFYDNLEFRKHLYFTNI